MKPRYYQQEAHDAVIRHVRKNQRPCLISMATGTGKSVIVSMIADTMFNLSKGKRVLCIQPSKELVEQNHKKFIQVTNRQASIYCASITKSLAHPTVFASPQTIKNNLQHLHGQFCAIIIDEAHMITNTVKYIIYQMLSANPTLRVIGMTATPYRTNTGHIYDLKINGEIQDGAFRPFFDKLVYEYTARQGIDDNYLTEPTTDLPHEIEGYDCSALVRGADDFTAASLEAMLTGQERTTYKICQQIVEDHNHNAGIMFFATTIQHAEEITKNLLGMVGDNQVNLVTGKTPKQEREGIINRFKLKRFKYLVNVDVLTTGFDAPHVDVIAILRPTSSPVLITQIIGRGIRLAEGKQTFFVRDYAENIRRHKLEDDLFNPRITCKGQPKEDPEALDVVCPVCSGINKLNRRTDPAYTGLEVSEQGTFLDLQGSDTKIPAHYGRRCQYVNQKGEQCEHRWHSKECPHCEAHNDIAARHCAQCGAEIIDPNQKLQEEHQKIKKDPYAESWDDVLSWDSLFTKSKKGEDMLIVHFQTECRKVTAYYTMSRSWEFAQLVKATFPQARGFPTVLQWWQNVSKAKMPNNILVKKDRKTKFFRVRGYNNEDI